MDTTVNKKEFAYKVAGREREKDADLYIWTDHTQ